mgnify:CR=1 FL=1
MLLTLGKEQMMSKYYNNAIIGNKELVASFSEEGELIRICFPQIDGRQFVDFFRTGVKVNDSNLIYLHQDINNRYNQRYIENTNVLVTDIENTYFNLNIEQTDCVLIDKNILLKKYVFKNNNSIDLDVKFIVNSKILSNNLENFGSRIIGNGIIQYNHNYSLSIFSNNELYGHRLNDVQNIINSAVIQDKDYIGMSNEVAISYNLGIIKKGESREFFVYVYLSEDTKIDDEIDKFSKIDANLEIDKVT